MSAANRGSHGQEVWAKPTMTGMAVVLVNRADTTTANVTVQFADLGKPGSAPTQVRDLYEEKSLGSYTGMFTAVDVPPHGVVMVSITCEDRVRGVTARRGVDGGGGGG